MWNIQRKPYRKKAGKKKESMVKTNKKKRQPKPLAPPPQMKSRKRARIVTTLFHKNTRLRDEALERGDEETAQRYEEEITKMGGREEYQRASQLSTSFFSTSKWVIRTLSSFQWLHQGIPVHNNGDPAEEDSSILTRRNIKLLEIGAINTELLDAATKTRKCQTKKKLDESDHTENNWIEKPLYKLNVRAIDLRSSQDGIEEMDFLQLPIDGSFDVIVCSMVLNCVTSSQDRGKMLSLIYHQLRPGGYCFLTIPKLCLSQSPHMSPQYFQQLLSDGGCGFTIYETKESPKVAFYILQRPTTITNSHTVSKKFQTLQVLKRGKKYRNKFAVVLSPDEVSGKAFDLS